MLKRGRFTVAIALSLLSLASAAHAAVWSYTNSGPLALPDSNWPSSGEESYVGFEFNNQGAVTVTGHAFIGRRTTTGAFVESNYALFSNGSDSVSGASLHIVGGATLTLQGPAACLYNPLGNTVTIDAGGALVLRANDDGNLVTYGHVTNVNNYRGTWVQAGALKLAPSNTNFMVSSYGLYRVVGNDATIERLPVPRSTGSTDYLILNRNTTDPNNVYYGTLTGGGRLTYVNSSGDANRDAMKIINYGVIDPGDAGVGTLELRNCNVLFGSTKGVLQIDLAGTGAGKFDVLTISGSSGQLDVHSANTELDVSLLDGFIPQQGDTWRILNYGSLYGFGQSYQGFTTIPGGYAVNYYSTYAELTYTVPEPCTLALLGVAGAGLVLRRRRTHCQ